MFSISMQQNIGDKCNHYSLFFYLGFSYELIRDPGQVNYVVIQLVIHKLNKLFYTAHSSQNMHEKTMANENWCEKNICLMSFEM